ncbi:MAG: hypothetical protein JOZ62_23690, partial [Acidobacteriaceae bacterium]|nr:hypothetical protein [Acidobacteriaceae bacterium]
MSAVRYLPVGCLLSFAFGLAVGNSRHEPVPVHVNVQPLELLKPAKENWLTYHGGYSGQRFSGLTQIDVTNAGRLRAQWVFHARNSNLLEATPVVVNGLMLVTSANDAFALDAETG